jgi:hypothetical protein
MKRCTVRLGLSLMLAMGWWVQRLPAQAPAAPSPAPQAQAPCACAAAQNGYAGPEQPGQGNAVRRAFNRHGVCCYTTHNVPGCGSLHSELTFIFGSCRVFFGEPCLNPPPRVPAPAYGVYGH